jgi:hypothetical protein
VKEKQVEGWIGRQQIVMAANDQKFAKGTLVPQLD